MTLFLDTCDSEQTVIYLIDTKFLAAHIWPSKKTQQESLHIEIAKFLKKSKVLLKDLDKVGVVVGPGHFSRVRTGVVTANTLAYALGIPVVGIKKLEEIDFKNILKLKGQKSVEVYYDREPNITAPKKK